MKTCRVGIGAECGEPVYPGGEVCAKHFEWYHGRPPPIARDAGGTTAPESSPLYDMAVRSALSADGATGPEKEAEWTTLEELRNGAIFETRDNVLAVKTRYHSKRGAIDCFLLASGESAWFDQPANRPEVHNATEVREIPPLAIPCGTVAASVAVVAEWGKFLANVANGHVNVLAVESAIRRLEEELFE